MVYEDGDVRYSISLLQPSKYFIGDRLLRKIKYSVHMHVISNWVRVFVQVNKDDRNAKCQSNTNYPLTCYPSHYSSMTLH